MHTGSVNPWSDLIPMNDNTSPKFVKKTNFLSRSSVSGRQGHILKTYKNLKSSQIMPHMHTHLIW